MIQAFYSGAAGLKAHQTAVDVISNNVANVNTTSYKSKQEDFSSLLNHSMVRPTTRNSATLLEGAGSAVDGVQTDISEGAPQQTQNKTDYYINGEGFFAVRDNAGNTFYTRDGSFHIVNDASGKHLETSDGMAVLGANGRVATVNAQGIGKPGVFTFARSSGLIPAGENLYTAGNLSGAATPGTATVETGMLEGSNVDLAQQMTDLIMSQRGYQLNSSVVSTSDQIESMINSLGQS